MINHDKLLLPWGQFTYIYIYMYIYVYMSYVYIDLIIFESEFLFLCPCFSLHPIIMFDYHHVRSLDHPGHVHLGWIIQGMYTWLCVKNAATEWVIWCHMMSYFWYGKNDPFPIFNDFLLSPTSFESNSYLSRKPRKAMLTTRSKWLICSHAE